MKGLAASHLFFGGGALDTLASSSARATTIALVSATAATSHEVVWGSVLSHVVGNTAWGVGLALTVFMAGMGAGALLAHRFLPRIARVRRAYIAVEVTIAVGALIADGAFLWAGLPSSYLGASAPGITHSIVDLGYVFVATMLPALAMGATYPLLVAAVVQDASRSRLLTTLYVSGLVGGVTGVLLCSIIVAPRVGFDGAAVVAAALNLVAAVLACVFLDPRRPGPPVQDEQGAGNGLGQAVLVFSSAGILGLGSQIVWSRSVVPYAGVSTFSFSGIVAAYLLAQSLGMAFGRRLSRESARAAKDWALALAPTVALICLAPLSSVASLIPRRDDTPALWLLVSALTIFVAVGPTALLLGVAQCGALRLIEARSGGWARGAAWVSGVGTLFSAGSAAVTAMVLFPLLGPRSTIAILGGVGLVALLIRRRAKLVATAMLATAVLLVTAPGPGYFIGAAYESAPVLYAENGVQDTTAIVLKDHPLERRIRRLVANGMSYSGDSLFAQRYMRLLGHLPALAAAGEHQALVVCIGTGTTAAALLPYRYARIDAVDISPSIRTTLGYFRRVNNDLVKQPHVRIIVEDGERWMRLTTDHYDVITLEPPPPRAPGAAALYSREFYEVARAHLAPGGVLAQWLPLHGLTGREASIITRTFVEVFPNAHLYLAERNEAILLGGAAGADLDEGHPARLEGGEVQDDLDRIGMKGRNPLVETLVAGPEALARVTRGVPVMRCAWPMTELMPLSSSGTPETLDCWVERLASRADSSNGAPTSGSTLLSALPAFIRVREGRSLPADRETVHSAMLNLLRADPDNEYTHYMFGFGRYLEARLKRMEDRLREGEAQRMRTIMARHKSMIE